MRTNPSPCILALAALLLLAGCAALSPTASPELSAVPAGINDAFLAADLDPAAWVERWEVESREICAARAEIVAAVRLSPGDAVADVGAGTGLFVGPFSRAVGPGGRVFAVEISPGFVEHLRGRAAREGLGNVEVVLSREDSTELAAGSVDVVYVCDTYHHFERHEAMLASSRAALRPGGAFVVVDFERIPGVSSDWVLEHVRAGKETFRGEIERAGFRFEEEVEVPGLAENYLLRFRRP
jgi:predicted methyltransferase